MFHLKIKLGYTKDQSSWNIANKSRATIWIFRENKEKINGKHILDHDYYQVKVLNFYYGISLHL